MRSGQTCDSNLQQLVGEIPWGQNLIIVSRVKDNKEKEFYIRKTFEYGWTRDVLIHQIEAEKTGPGCGQESYLTGRVGPQ